MDSIFLNKLPIYGDCEKQPYSLILHYQKNYNMKNLRTIMATLLAAVAFVCLTACGGDDDEPAPAGSAQEVAGTYRSDIHWNVAGTPGTISGVTVTVADAGESNVNVSFSEFGPSDDMIIPAFTLKDVKVAMKDGVCTLGPASCTGTLASGKEFSIMDFNGTYKNGTLSVSFMFRYGAMPPMTCTYDAPKQN